MQLNLPLRIFSRVFYRRLFTPFILVLSAMSFIRPALAQDGEAFNLELFSAHDPHSSNSINYENWTGMLKATVVRARSSSREYAKKPSAGIGAKINLANPNPSRLEASRVLYRRLEQADIDYVHNLRRAMEMLPETIGFQTLNRNAQLAYWLNLYNITVYEMVAKRSPIRKIKDLRKGRRNRPSLWDEKILHVKGIALSLNDIQYKIIHKIWPDPMVIYGLYHGAIGGPNLAKKAYTSQNVYSLLDANAEEFINSLRGMRFWGKDVHVSEMYQWNKEFFPNFEPDLRRHLRKYTNFRLSARLDSSRKIKAKIYDWYTADAINANMYAANGSASTNPVAMVMSSTGTSMPHVGKAWSTSVRKLGQQNNSDAFLKDFLKYNNKNAVKITIEGLSEEDLKEIRQRQNNTEEKE